VIHRSDVFPDHAGIASELAFMSPDLAAASDIDQNMPTAIMA
jgi:hypothetical protein